MFIQTLLNNLLLTLALCIDVDDLFSLRSVKIALAVLAPVYCTPWTTSALPNGTNLSCKVFFLLILGHFMQK